MTTVNLAWIDRLFQRFSEIYGNNAENIDKSLETWTFALNGVSAEQIKEALAKCKETPTCLPTPESFREICLQVNSLSNNNSISLHSKAITAVNDEAGRVPALKWPERKQEASKVVRDARQMKEWQKKLMAMDEREALGLSCEDRYDRTRLLMEKQGREQVTRLAAIAPKEKPINRRDWE